MLKRSYAQLATSSSSLRLPSTTATTGTNPYSSSFTPAPAHNHAASLPPKMKTLQISNTLNRSSSSSSSLLRTSSSGVDVAKKMKKYESAEEVQASSTSTVDVEEAAAINEPQLDGIHSKKEDLLSDEEECTPGATKSKPVTQQAKIDSKKKKKKKTIEVAVKKEEVAPVPKELAKETEDERECYRHAIVDVPALVELLTLIGRCPVCKSSLRTDKIATDEATAVVNVSLKCSRLRCQFTKHWCSSPTAGISTTEAAKK